MPTHYVDAAEFIATAPRHGERLTLAYSADVHGNIAATQSIGELVRESKKLGVIDLFATVGDEYEGADDPEVAIMCHQLLNEYANVGTIGNHNFDPHDQRDLRVGYERIIRTLEHPDALSDEDLRTLQRKADVLASLLDHKVSLYGQIVATSAFPIVTSNVVFQPGTLLGMQRDEGKILDHFVVSYGERKLVFFGVTTPHLEACLDYHKRNGWDGSTSVLSQIGPLLRQAVEAVRMQPDLQNATVIVLSHAGLGLDETEVAQPGVHLVLGGHTHNRIHRRVVHEDGSTTDIVHSGQNGEYAGIVSGLVAKDGALADVSHTLVRTPPLDLSAIEFDAHSHVVISGEVVGACGVDFSLAGKSSRSTPLMRLVADSFREACGTECAFAIAGQVRGGFTTGKVFESDVAGCLKWDDMLVAAVLEPTELRSLIEWSIATATIGKLHHPTLLHGSGIHYAVNEATEVSEIRFANGRMVDRPVTVALPGFLESMSRAAFDELGIPHFEETGISIRDALTSYLHAQSPLNDAGDDRFSIDRRARVLWNEESVSTT
jgi:hypothetical protein